MFFLILLNDLRQCNSPFLTVRFLGIKDTPQNPVLYLYVKIHLRKNGLDDKQP